MKENPRMFLRVCHSVQVGNDRIMIRSTNTCYADIGLWITMDTGILLCNIPAYLVYANLGPDQIKALTSFYTFNGCDTTFCFSERVKKPLCFKTCSTVKLSCQEQVNSPEEKSELCLSNVWAIASTMLCCCSWGHHQLGKSINQDKSSLPKVQGKLKT